MSVLIIVLLLIVMLGLVAPLAYRRIVVLATPHERVLIAGRHPSRLHVSSGWTLYNPLLERVVLLKVSPIPIRVNIAQARTKKGVPLDLIVEARVEVETHSPGVERAAQLLSSLLDSSLPPQERLLEHLENVLSATVRAQLALRVTEEVVLDASAFNALLTEAFHQILSSFGLSVEGVELKHLTGPSGYLEALGTLMGPGFARSLERLGRDASAKLASTAPIGADPLAFLPAPRLGVKLKVEALDPSGARASLRLDKESLELVSGSDTIASIALGSPHTVMLSHSMDGPEVLIHVDIRQQRMGASTRLGLSSGTATFPEPVNGLSMQPNVFPRLEEADMLRLLAALRGMMQANGEESWGYM